MRELQIGVIGSMADIKLEESLKQLAKGVGKEIAKNHAILVFGLEEDFDSIPTIAAQAARKAGGKTLAFAWGTDKPNLEKFNSNLVVTGQQRGGGREFSLVLSCDALICLSGGSGTLMEIAMAYQAEIPIVALKGTSGWSDKLRNQFLDNRKRQRIFEARNPKHAVETALKLAKANLSRSLKAV